MSAPASIPRQEHGRLFWITGLAGAGKSTVGRELAGLLRRENPAVVFLDGDEMRAVLNGAAGTDPADAYSPSSRADLAMRYARLCALLTRQGLDVVCATISMFHACRDWNRSNIPGYLEVYLKVPRAVLEARDQKGLYSRARSGSAVGAVGVDQPCEEPREPDLEFTNDGTSSPAEIALEIKRTGDLRIPGKGLRA